MLQAIREKTSGWIAYVIIGLISIPFALWGVNSYLGGGEQQPAAIVDGVEISARQLDFSYGQYRQRLASVFGGSLPSAFGDDNTLKEQVLSQVIEEQVLLGFVRDEGFRVGDAELFQVIQAMDVFQQDGRFNAELYRNQLASQGYLPAQFEEEIRRSQEMQQLSRAVRASSLLLPKQQEAYQRLRNQQRKLRVLTVVNDSEGIEISDSEIEQYYNDQPNRFMTQARVKVDYLEVNLETVRDALDVTDDMIRERYDQAREQLTTPEIRSASHILLTVAQEADDAEQARVEEAIKALKQRIDSGEDFATLARENSQDPGSAVDGGDLGEVERGIMVQPFENALFAMSPGEVSDPVRTQFGWHLIKLREVSGGETQTFEEARAQLDADIRNELAENQIYDLAEGLSNITFEQPDSLLPAAEQLGLTVQTTDWFTRNEGAGLAAERRVRQAAFSDEVLNQNRNSEALELSDNRVVVIHLNEQQPAARQPLEEVREAIQAELKSRQGRERAQQRGQELLAALEGGETLDQVAARTGLEIDDVGLVGRQSDALRRDLLNAAFTMSKPEGSAIYEGVSEVTGDYSLLELTEIQAGGAQAVEQAEWDSLRNNAGDYQYQALLKILTQQADVQRTPVSELQ